MAIQLTVNGRSVAVEAASDTPLLWVLRDELGLTGTKYGCGIAQCGACTVHLNGEPVRSCTLPVAAAAGGKITTIEGLSKHGDHPVQKAWEELDVVQCGYCQSGQILSAAALIDKNQRPGDADIEAAMSGNVCRCASYARIKKAIKRAGAIAGGEG